MAKPTLAGQTRGTDTQSTMKHLSLLLVLVAAAAVQTRAAVQLERLPQGALQPDVAVDAKGATHLIYLVGDPKASDIEYRRRSGNGEWSPPIRVNSQPGSAIAIGTIRGPRLALGRDGRPQVVWNGSQKADPKPAAGGSPLLHARLLPDGKGFSAQRDLMGATHELDGGGAVASDGAGRVLVVWHASPAGRHGETNRAVFATLSTDDGATFEPERAISPAGIGACGCCGLTASMDSEGGAAVLFRAARTPNQRDMALLVSTNGGVDFEERFSHPWAVGVCPMSSAAIAFSGGKALAAWETAGRVWLGDFPPKGAEAKPRAVGPEKGAKHPRVATNANGETLMVWTEGTGWQRGGALAWQLFDRLGKPVGERGREEGLPAWSFAAAHALPNGDFLILH